MLKRNFPALPPLAAALLLSITAGACSAQSAAGLVLKPGQVTESALVDALAIDTAPSDSSSSGASGSVSGEAPLPDGIVTRGLRPATSSAQKVAERKPAGPGKASLMITFATGSSEPTPESMRALETVARALQSDRLATLSFRVEGHADPRGSADRNQQLSADRAAAVVSVLSSRFGISTQRLQSVGRGSSELINPGRPDAPENRRVTIITNR